MLDLFLKIFWKNPIFLALLDMAKSKNLRNHFLITTPQSNESLFNKGIIYICEHNKDGAMGVMINKPIPDIEKVLSKFDLKNISPKPSVYLGGPVDLNKGFVIHQNDYETNGTIEVSKKISLTSNLKIISDILDGNGPDNFRFVLGYSGWGPGQLENELKRGDWMILPADQKLIFNTPDNIMWKTAYMKLGINVGDFGGQSGIS